MHVLYSFPHPLGGAGIGTAAWHHVDALARAGARVTVVCTTVQRPLDPDLDVRTISVLGAIRPRMIGRGRAADLIDRVTAYQVRTRRPDVVHTWPGAVLHTAARAAGLGVPTVREAPSPYTRAAIAQAARAWGDVGLRVPEGHFHQIPESALAREDREFQAVDLVLVGSPEAAATFSEAQFPVRLAVSRYGFDALAFKRRPAVDGPRTAVFVGRCEPTKGIHVLLRAWARATRPPGSRLLLRGEMTAEVRKLLARELDDSSVVEWPRVDDVAAFLSDADLMVLPSFSEGSALISYESLGAGVVPLVSRATGSPVAHDVDGLVHDTGDESELVSHLNRMLNDPEDWRRLRENGRTTAESWTWDAAGGRLLEVYRGLVDDVGKGAPPQRA